MSRMQNVINGLNLLSSCGKQYNNVSVGHDTFYAAGPVPEEMSAEQIQILEDNDWDWSEEYESWYIFV